MKFRAGELGVTWPLVYNIQSMKTKTRESQNSVLSLSLSSYKSHFFIIHFISVMPDACVSVIRASDHSSEAACLQHCCVAKIKTGCNSDNSCRLRTFTFLKAALQSLLWPAESQRSACLNVSQRSVAHALLGYH